jgi:hypothetical protein
VLNGLLVASEAGKPVAPHELVFGSEVNVHQIYGQRKVPDVDNKGNEEGDGDDVLDSVEQDEAQNYCYLFDN